MPLLLSSVFGPLAEPALLKSSGTVFWRGLGLVSETVTLRRSATVVFAGCGSGGHLYPALAIAEAIRARLGSVRFVFFGTQRSVDRKIVEGASCELVAQTLPRISRKPWSWPIAVWDYRRARHSCRSSLAQLEPLAMIGSGGMASFAAMREARRAGVPTVIFNPDALAGKANRRLAAVADLICVQWEETVARFPGRARVEVTGCPVRPAFHGPDRAAGLAEFGLDPQRKTLLITGASQGARSVNRAVAANLEFLASRQDWQVLHLTGDLDYEEVRAAYGARPVAGRVIAYTERMAEALAVADLVVARAGASTLAEIVAVGRASILMPYPHGNRHQLANARCLSRLGAAEVMLDAVNPVENGPALRAVMSSLMDDDDAREQMAAAAKAMGRLDAADCIADRVLELARARGMNCATESVEPAI